MGNLISEDDSAIYAFDSPISSNGGVFSSIRKTSKMANNESGEFNDPQTERLRKSIFAEESPHEFSDSDSMKKSKSIFGNLIYKFK